MQAADRSILATLAYAGAHGWPLTSLETWQRLIPGARLGASSPRPSLEEVVRRLRKLADDGKAAEHHGLYGPAGMDEARLAGRVRREKENAHKWRRLRPYVRWLAAAPFVRALLASGSLAAGSSGPHSDWDMLVIAERGRLYTARLFLSAAAALTGRLRTKDRSMAPDTFCFNHWLTTDGLRLRHEGLFTARVLSGLLPVWDPQDFHGRLVQANRWTEDFGPRPAGGPWVRRAVAIHPVASAVGRLAEAVLRTPLGDGLERILASWMRGRIAATPATHEPGGRIIADERELEFHPRSQEAAVLASYNASLAGLGLGVHAERDSGLTK